MERAPCPPGSPNGRCVVPVFPLPNVNDQDNTWTIDGIPVTDMVATGTSPAQYDFDAINHIQVTTGGAALLEERFQERLIAGERPLLLRR